MFSNPVIRVENLSKSYVLYDKPQDRLKQFVWRGRRNYGREFSALKDVSFTLHKGEVLGVIGQNGAGKSTLLQLICGTLSPSSGHVEVNGRIAALLELGSGFNREFTGRENIYMSAAISGMGREEIERRFNDIVAFSGVGAFIDQPVKTYSSGMYVRLAFSVAINVDPDILVIDEALSVGDREFARKSFERIMALKDAGKTILFCSHSMYQVEAICNRVIWLNRGVVQMAGEPAAVVVAYNEYLDAREKNSSEQAAVKPHTPPPAIAGILRVRVFSDGMEGTELHVRSGESTVGVTVEFKSDPALPVPSAAVMITDAAARPIASAGTKNDGLDLACNEGGIGRAHVTFERIALLKGTYWVYAFLLCENAVHIYETANMVAQLHVTQQGMELGVVSLPHAWS